MCIRDSIGGVRRPMFKQRGIVQQFLRICVAQFMRLFVLYVPPRRRGMNAVRVVEKYVRPPARRLVAKQASGYSVACDLNDSVQKSLFYRGTWEPAESALVAGALPRGGRFLDVGANAGHYSLLAASVVGATGRVVAIEASCLNAARLRATIALNRLGSRIELYLS